MPATLPVIAPPVAAPPVAAPPAADPPTAALPNVNNPGNVAGGQDVENALDVAYR